MSHELTRWIEDADARRFSEAVVFERGLELREHHFLHLGHAIAYLPTWLRHSVERDAPAPVGGSVVPFVRRPMEHRDH